MEFYNFQREAASTQMTMAKNFPQADRRSVSDPDIMIYPYKIHMVISKVVIKDVRPKPNVTRRLTALSPFKHPPILLTRSTRFLVTRYEKFQGLFESNKNKT